MNVIFEIGNLTQDPELRYTTEGTAVTQFNLAVNEKFNGNEKVHFFPIVCWKKLAEAVTEYQKKGSKVAVTGRLEQQRWKDGNGNKRSMIKIVASRVEFLDRRKKGEEASVEEPPVEEPLGGDNPSVGEESLVEEEPPVGDEEDIPF